jgi:hypothetical protein
MSLDLTVFRVYNYVIVAVLSVAWCPPRNMAITRVRRLPDLMIRFEIILTDRPHFTGWSESLHLRAEWVCSGG